MMASHTPFSATAQPPLARPALAQPPLAKPPLAKPALAIPAPALALAAALLALGGCAQEGAATGSGGLSSAEAESRSQCFPVSAVRGYREGPEDNQIYVDAGRDTYLFETFGPCPDLDFSWALAFDVRPGNFICHATDVDIILPQANVGPRRCPVRMIRQLSEAEREAL